jgi:hypothetical protein
VRDSPQSLALSGNSTTLCRGNLCLQQTTLYAASILNREKTMVSRTLRLTRFASVPDMIATSIESSSGTASPISNTTACSS